MKSCKTPLWRVMSFLTLCLPLVFMLAFSGQALAVCPGDATAVPPVVPSLFEDDDGDLDKDGTCLDGTTSDLDWNNFMSTVDWSTPPAAPYRVGNATALGWIFVGQEDDQVSTADTAFAGGVKQDAFCAKLKDGKAPNKDDLKRIYLSTKTINGHTILNLAWVRIPQNTTSASAHVGFEFNQGTTLCDTADPDGLVERVAGDMLVVYDFEGGTTDPVITLRRWLTDVTDADQSEFFQNLAKPCDVDSNSPPCWGDSRNLTALGFAEAGVNVGATVFDDINPPPPLGENLADSEFGEAGIDLTAAGVFEEGQCANFGTAFGVSRSSGNSGQAQMKDLVGPVEFTLANCGTVIIRKETIPEEDPNSTSFGFTTTVTTTPATTTSPFTLMDDGIETIVNVNPGTGLTVSEDDPGPEYLLTDIDCSASMLTTALDDDEMNGDDDVDESSGTVTFDIAAGDTLDCTFYNTFQTGDITFTKHVINECRADTSTFTLNVGPETGTVGDGQTVSALGLAPGDYELSEDDPGGEWLISAIYGEAGCGSTVTLGPDEVIDCDIDNTRLPHIRITKVNLGNPDVEFDLRIIKEEGGSYDPANAVSVVDNDGIAGGTLLSGEVTVGIGTYRIYETLANGDSVSLDDWLPTIKCSDDSSVQGQFNLDGRTVGSGDLLECTITNDPTLETLACVPDDPL